MTGRPKRTALLAELERRTRAAFPEDEEKTHLDYVVSWQTSGNTLLRLAADLDMSWDYVKDYLNRTFGREETNARLARAREDGAHRLVDQVLSTADDADEDNVQVKRLQVDARKWVAEKWNPRELGAKTGPTLNLTVGTLHLGALQSAPPPPQRAISDAIDAVAEVLSIEPATPSEDE